MHRYEFTDGQLTLPIFLDFVGKRNDSILIAVVNNLAGNFDTTVYGIRENIASHTCLSLMNWKFWYMKSPNSPSYLKIQYHDNFNLSFP